MKLGGTLIIRNAIEFDYCIEAAIRSLVPVCDEIVVLDGYSDDGTETLLARLDEELGIRVLKHAWQPSPLGAWLADLTNYAREQLTTEMHLCLQGDEVVNEQDYDLIRAAAETGEPHLVERLNFYSDHRHTLPPNEKVGQTICRIAPKHARSLGDAQGLDLWQKARRSPIRFHHYGFIRKVAPLAAKSKMMHTAFFNTYDPMLDVLEKEGLSAMTDPRWSTSVPVERLVPYGGNHPLVAHGWLKERGFEP